MARPRFMTVGRFSGEQFEGSSRNIDGSMRKNTKVGVDIDLNAIRNLIRTELKLKEAYKGTDKKPIKTDHQEPSSNKEISQKKAGGWKMSTASATMLATNAIGMGTSIMSAHKSTDAAKMEQVQVKAIANYGILALGALGGPKGMVAAIGLSFVKNSFGDILFNKMQMQHDNRRLNYRLNNYDLSRQSTRVYDYNKESWVSQDADNAKKNILGRK